MAGKVVLWVIILQFTPMLFQAETNFTGFVNTTTREDAYENSTGDIYSNGSVSIPISNDLVQSLANLLSGSGQELCDSKTIHGSPTNVSLSDALEIILSQLSSGDYNMADSCVAGVVIPIAFLLRNSGLNFTNNTVNLQVNDTRDNIIIDTGHKSGNFAIIHQGRISEATYNNFNVIFNYFYLPASIIGFGCNTINVIVFCQRRMAGPTSTILIWFCCCEAVFVLNSIIYASITLHNGKQAMFNRFYLLYSVYIGTYFIVAIRRVGFCYSVLVSIERFIAVSFPLKALSFRLCKHPSITCFIILICSLVFHIFSALKFSVVPFNFGNKTGHMFVFTELYLDNQNHFRKVSMASKFIFVYIMLLICFVLNILIVNILRKQTKMRKSLTVVAEVSEHVRRERQTTVTIIVSNLVDIFLALPLSTNSILMNFNSDYGVFTKQHFLFLVISKAGDMCEIISSCTSFLFFVFLSDNFRRTFIQLFSSCRKRGHGLVRSRTLPSSSVSYTTSSSDTQHDRTVSPRQVSLNVCNIAHT